MLRNMGYWKKLLLLPALAALAFLLMLFMVQRLERSNQELMSSIEVGYFPALDLATDLAGLLRDTQRAFDDAVTARDAARIADAQPLYDQFLQRLDAARETSADSVGLLEIQAGYQSFFELGRAANERLIAEGPTEEALDDLRLTRDSYSRIDAILGRAAAQQNRNIESAFAAARKNTAGAVGRMTLLLLTTLAALAILWFFISRSITRPLAFAVNVADRIAQGNLDAEIEPRRRDEAGQLLASMRQTIAYLREMADVATAIGEGHLRVEVEPRSEHDTFGHAFHKMTLQIRRMIGDLKSSSTQVLAAAEQISISANEITDGAGAQSAATEETSSTMVEIASQIDTVSRSTQALATGVEETSCSVQEMAASIDEVARNSDNLLSAVEETSATIEEMTASIESIARKVQRVDAVSKEAAQAARLGGGELARTISGIESSNQDIGKIVQIIEDIADQTNLLALNAAIEAARAGEAGRGFAVVANEVKRLAERSVSSTREISKVVDGVQTETQQAVTLIQETLDGIVNSVTKTTALVGEVSLATEEQSSGAQQILGTSQNMQLVTQQVAAAAKQQSSSAVEITRAVEEMNQMTQQVAASGFEQKRGGNLVVKAVEEIAQIAHRNVEATHQLSQATLNLTDEAQRLTQMAAVFEI